jgi:hypothetical protein
MSYDVSLYFEVNGRRYRPIGDINYTSNVRDVLNAAFDGNYWVEAIENKVASEAIPLLSAAITKLSGNIKELEALAPKNGWGSVVGARQFLDTIRSQCYENPDLFIEISK